MLLMKYFFLINLGLEDVDYKKNVYNIFSFVVCSYNNIIIKYDR